MGFLGRFNRSKPTQPASNGDHSQCLTEERVRELFLDLLRAHVKRGRYGGWDVDVPHRPLTIAQLRKMSVEEILEQPVEEVDEALRQGR